MAKKPNVVVIYTDDLGYGDLSCYGSDAIKTPHLDALAEDGVRFTDWYSNSPVCSPSRAALLTGRYPNRAGVPRILAGKRGTPGLPPTEMTLASALKPHGYRTALFGKWHLGVAEEMRPNQHGFDEFFGFLAGCVDYYSHIFYWQQAKGVNPLHDLWHNEREVWYNGRYFTELMTEKAVDFIERGTSDDPFFLFASYNAPHYPMHAPKAYLDRYPDLPPDRRIMAAMISAVDDGVGSIVKALKDAGEYENTLIFFSSDNGPSRETRNWLDGNEDLYYGGTAGIFRGHKGSLYEGGIREPAILAYPGTFPAGQTIDTPCAMFDVFPTVFEAAGLPLPDHPIDGQSVLGLVTGEESAPHEQIFWEYGPNQLAVREGNWKLVLNGREDGVETVEESHLANLADDPSEKLNLAEEEPEVVARLSEAVKVWDQEIGGHA